MRIFYQSYVNAELSEPYLRHLKMYLNRVAAEATEVPVAELTPPDNYAHGVVEYRCGYQAVCHAIQAERGGFDAVVLGHFQDSGLQEARAALGIPVVGLGEATMLYACSLARKIGLVTINPRFIPFHNEQILRYGLEKRIGAYCQPPQQVLDQCLSLIRTS